jgi:[protein-PII] uridylyltransferase
LRTLDLNPSEVDRLRYTLERVVLGKIEVRQLLQNRAKAAPAGRKVRFRGSVSFNSEASNHSTLIEIAAEDRPGLLYELASAISSEGCNIEVVLIDTEAHRALDVFYVTSGGEKLTPEKQQNLARMLQRVCGA